MQAATPAPSTTARLSHGSDAQPFGHPGQSHVDFDASHGRRVHARGAAEALPVVTAAVARWLRERRDAYARARSRKIALRELRGLDRHLLRDIGIETRALIPDFVYGLDEEGRPRRSRLQAAIAFLSDFRKGDTPPKPTDKAA